jgi:F-type H+-transporting ATPase subunit c
MNQKSKLVMLAMLLLAILAAPAFAQEAGAAGAADHGPDYGTLGAAFAIGVAAFGGALGQAKAVSSACSGMARNPGATGNIRTTLIIGLAFIESLVIYALVIALKGVGII